ncbi:MAG: Ig-like domain-containing protein [Gemmiger formicilis]|uniref:Ig-like domain-containing protein n=1 Tax=Gemmiger formicilis TaxID=745368 RepID=UPI003FEED518|nr:Ig-like domain-containing protein [Gemmiger formicilis]
MAVSAGTAEAALSSKDGKITASKTIEVVVTPTGITTTDALTLAAGEAATLETAIAPDDATHVSISYTSSDDAVATVSDAGEVTAVTADDATITAAVDGTALSAACKVTVLPAIESIELNYTTLSLQPEGTAQLNYTVAPEEALADTATYTSSNETVATVDAEGNVTAIADGTVTITVDVNGVAAECEVTVSTPSKTSGRTGSASDNGNNATSSTYVPSQASEAQAAQSGATASFEYGGVPFGAATDDNIWYIDSGDSAYWACANKVIRDANASPTSTFLSVENSSLPVAIVNDHIATTKQEPELHGFGLRNVMETLHKYDAFSPNVLQKQFLFVLC